MSDLLFKKPDGSFVTVPDTSTEAAQAKGYTPATPEQVQAGGQTGQAALEGAARGATMGFGDTLIADAENAFGPAQTGGISGLEAQRAQTLEQMRLRKQENPNAALAGEVGGAVGMAALTGGGPSALVGGGLKGALLEGGLMGLGGVVSESTLDKSPLTMEKMAAGMAGGALAAGGIHGTMTVLGKGVSAGLKRLGGSTLSDTFKTAADKAEFDALTPSAKWAERNKGRAPELLAYGKDKGVISGAGINDETAAKARDLAKSYAPVISDELRQVESVVPLKGDKALRNEAADYMERRLKSEFADSPAHEDAMKTARKFIASVRDVDRDWNGFWKLQTSLFEDLPRDAAGNPLPAAKAVRNELRNSMRDFVYEEVASGKNKAGKILAGVEPTSGMKVKFPAPEINSRTIQLGDSPVSGGLQLAESAPTRIEGAHPDLAGTSAELESLHGAPSIDNLPLASRPQGTVAIEGATSQPGGVFEFPGTRTVKTAEIPGPSQRLDMRPDVKDIAPVTVHLGGEPVAPGGLVLDTPAKVTPEWLGAKMRQTGREASMAQALADAMEKRSGKLGKGNWDRSINGLTMALATGNPLAAVPGLASDVLGNQVRRRGGFMLGSVLRKLGDSSALEGITKGLESRVGQVLATAPNMLGAARMPLEAAFGRGSAALLSEYLRIASGPDGPQLVSALGLTNETPEEVQNVGHRLASMDALHAAQADVDHRIDLGIDSVLGTKKGPSARYKAPDISDFSERISLMKETLADPTKAFENIPVELLGAPNTSAELVNKLLQANQFLASKAPKDPYEGMPTAIKPMWKPSASEVARWYRYVEAVEQPSAMLDKMAQGTFTLEHKEALQTIYPELYADIKARMFEKLATWDTRLPYGKRAMLSQFFGGSILGLKPGALGMLQGSFAPPLSDAPPSKGGTRPDGREQIDADKNAVTQMTKGQQLEGR